MSVSPEQALIIERLLMTAVIAGIVAAIACVIVSLIRNRHRK